MVVPREGLAGEEAENGADALASAPFQCLPFIVNPAHLVEHHLVEGRLSLGKEGPELPLYGIPVSFKDGR
jgi:hypothetical protein